ncbi:UDP-N-acetylmuramoyl-L-alanine--D-glutamate ligase [Gordonia sp. ABSL1-1]|uniref:UDP-N-acetylmuramoyl-L-alanine--D-glutamate ligase n=1 Tax=Gordonia sp. ABSL1-1 TaxID=3053923 RepID=UPI002573CBFF|nr:UDP-N-acetylmuramoyl-L-alanine--D-glutamate ligase [Gordonia sp. ABSL1-1]MDL9937404.1 UDP-N-acetylmuramoyl-L-alanine--D-glutamate ligase [Gordonia sp. ABSL1-1]
MADPTGPALDLADRPVLVAGAGTAGISAAGFLAEVGAQVGIADQRFADPAAAAEAGAAGLTPVAIRTLLDDPAWTERYSLVVVSPGFAPDNELVVAALAAGLPVWGEVELAWHVDRSGLLGAPRTWLVVTGTNGKTTTTSMLADIVAASGRSGAACGNIGLPVLDAMRMQPRVEVLCAELSSFQLHWAPSVRPDAGVVLNVADDHLDWHGSFAAYAAAKAGALTGTVGVVGLDDEVASGLAVTGRRVGFTLDEPADGELGVVDGMLTDRAFGAGMLLPADAIQPAGPSGRMDALAAAALALAVGVPREAVAAALSDFRPAGHRGEVVLVHDGIAFVDDSKATNPHAAQAAVAAHERVVLIAGGLLKGAPVDGLITAVRDRLAGVVAIGRDRDIILEAIARHAPEVPAVTVFTGDDGRVNVNRAGSAPHASAAPRSAAPGTTRDEVAAVAVMDRAVDVAWELAQTADRRPDAVLLAPAAASLDMFAGYGRRGDAFAAASRRVADAGADR